MTDNEIIQALECCVEDDSLCADSMACRICPMNNNYNCTFELRIHTLDLINRQKAEIERLRYNLKAVLDERADHTDAINECIARFEKKIKDVKFTIGLTWEIQSALKEVEKEMGVIQNES